MTRFLPYVASSLLLSLSSISCMVGDVGQGTGGSSGGADAGAGGEELCEGPLGAPILDFSAMEACCAPDAIGDAHCLDAAQVPDEIEAYLATCSDGSACVPDQFLSTGGAEPPTPCTAFGGDGVCLSQCIPQVAENAGLLRPDGCSGDELCVPCVSPLDGMPTGACDLSEHTVCEGEEGGGGGGGGGGGCDDPATCNYDEGCPPVIEPSTLPSCAADAHCVDQAIVAGADPEVVERLAACEGNPGTLCVPDVFIETGGKFTPLSCTSVNAAEGRCLSMALPDVAAQADLLPQDVCQASERCTPCFDPISGESTGACALSCDPGPQAAPQPFASCCEDRARCVPTGLVPAEDQDQLEQAECEDIDEDAYLCVPVQILDDGPYPTCEAFSLILGTYDGVCLSDCLDFGIQGIALAGGDCADNHKCVPCIQDGEPTGAPGCPAP